MRKDDNGIGGGEGQTTGGGEPKVEMPSPPADLAITIEDIRMAHRERCFHMEQRKRADLAIGSFLRTTFGWRKDGDPKLNERAREQAAALLEIGEADAAVRRLNEKAAREGPLKGHDKAALARGQAKLAVDEPAYFKWRATILAAIDGRRAFDLVEDEATKRMRELAATLPIYDWWRENVFEDPLQLAVIVGEAGDIGAYPSPYPEFLADGKTPHPRAGQARKASSGPGCVWKRMGVAVIGAGDGVDDKRQGGLPKSAPKEEWIEHGYNRKRRSRVFVIGDILIKQQGRYREIYLARKEYERKKAEARGLIVAPTASIPKKRQHEFMSHGHIDKRARRYMEKRLLKDLWKAWRRASLLLAERPVVALPAADQHKDAA